MTESLFQKIEEKVMILLGELESLRKELSHARQENHALKSEMLNSTQKLQGLVSLLETLDSPNEPVVSIEPHYLHEEAHA